MTDEEITEWYQATEDIELHPDSRNWPQWQAYHSEADILLYGGKPHGGKTFLQVLLPYLEHTNSLVIRRSFSELNAGVIKDSLKFYPVNEKHYNKSEHVWNLSGGKRIQYGYGERSESVQDNDFLQYKGPNWDYIGIDEAGEIKRFGDGATVIDLLISWNRTTISDQRCRMVLTTNPGGPGEDWLIEWFAPWLDDTYPDPADYGEIRFVYRDESGKLRFSKEKTQEHMFSLTYIEASWEDNPYTMQGYKEKNLMLLPEPLRSQLLAGKWGLGTQDDLWQVIPSDWIRLAQERWQDRPEVDFDAGGLDVAYGGQDSTVLSLKKGGWFARNRKWPGQKHQTGEAAATDVYPLIKHRRFPILVDAFGYGADCYGALKAKGARWCQAHFGNEVTEAITDEGNLGFDNTRSEAVWRLREALNPVSGANLALPPDRKLFSDLVAYRWQQCAKGIKVKPKRDMIKDLGRSPDDGDAVIMCWYAGYRNVARQIAEAFGGEEIRPGKYEGAF